MSRKGQPVVWETSVRLRENYWVFSLFPPWGQGYGGVKAEAAVDTGAGVTILDTQLSKMRTYLGFFYYINQVWK